VSKIKKSNSTVNVEEPEKFGPRADQILSKTSVYPPDQLMFGVENAADAKAFFRSQDRMPNLQGGGRYHDSFSFDGIWGEGAVPERAHKELNEGRLFIRNPDTGDVHAIGARTAHRWEQHFRNARFTAEGSAKITGQWADMALMALNKGHAHDLAKYLERVDDTLQRCRRLAGVGADEEFIGYVGEMQRLQSRIKSDPGLATDPQTIARAKRLLARAKAESALLANYNNAGPIKRAYLRVMLDGVAARNELGRTLETIGAHTPDWVNFTNAVKLIAMASATPEVAAAIGRGETDEAARLVTTYLQGAALKGLSLPSLAASVPGLSMATLARMIVEIRIQSIEGGVELAAGRQEPWDLISGFYTAWGAGEDSNPRFRRTRTVADLVAHIHSERQLEAFVYLMAKRAANQGARLPEWGPYTTRTIQQVTEAIFQRCWPAIRYAWLYEREMLMAEYLYRRSEIIHSSLLISYSPQKPAPNEQVIATVHSLGDHPQESLLRMEEILKLLYGSNSYISWHYIWAPEGSAYGSSKVRRSFVFQTPGKYEVAARLVFRPYPGGNDPRGFRSDNVIETRIMLEGEAETSVDVEVVGDATDPCQWLADMDHGRYFLLEDDLPDWITVEISMRSKNRRGESTYLSAPWTYTDLSGQKVTAHTCSLSIWGTFVVDVGEGKYNPNISISVGIIDDHDRAVWWARRDMPQPYLAEDWMLLRNDLGDPRISGNGGSIISPGNFMGIVYKNLTLLMDWLGSGLDKENSEHVMKTIGKLWIDKISQIND